MAWWLPWLPANRGIEARLWDVTPVTEVGLGKAAVTRVKARADTKWITGAGGCDTSDYGHI